MPSLVDDAHAAAAEFTEKEEVAERIGQPRSSVRRVHRLRCLEHGLQGRGEALGVLLGREEFAQLRRVVGIASNHHFRGFAVVHGFDAGGQDRAQEVGGVLRVGGFMGHGGASSSASRRRSKLKA